MTEKPNAAFIVQETDEGTGGVIFAKSAVEARRIGAHAYNGGEFSGLSVCRRRDLDRYAGQGVPASILVAEGWWFEGSCGHRISECDLEDRGLSPADVVGVEGGAIFCNEACRADYRRRKAAEDAAGRAFLDTMRLIVRRRLGDVAFRAGGFGERVYAVEEDGVVTIRQAVVSFDFPGMRYGPASLRYDPGPGVGPVLPQFQCCGGDREAFEAFAALRKIDA